MSEQIDYGELIAYGRERGVGYTVHRHPKDASVSHDNGVSFFDDVDIGIKLSEFKDKARTYFDQIRKDERLWK